MGEIVLVRHGQANSSATSEAEYDRLSELGHRQAEWLGDWLRANEGPFDAVHRGSLRRHAETAAGMGVEAEVDPRWDELDYFDLGHALAEAKGVPFPGPGEFAGHVVEVMEAWHAAEIRGREDWTSFEGRVGTALAEAATEGRRVLVVTSGGVIGMALRRVLGLDPARMAHVLVPILNTSVHRFEVRGDAAMLSGFNTVPHLEAEERRAARTTY
ncbi:histidine phosphatase family protein [Jannaschia sp. Os4]|uniref:histidine phosphatase family protein n=1 Tax=Jannaschia sp. Os4 TaxID=2807617 RepID=UPI0019393DFB|nr:histidine phosphatase family protein [Jannaschia sp. Os4]MBM2574970.1 histidine phosphatase family protein [Jannaschia sp. Os4]